MGEYYVDGQLFHHGIKGQKWGKRRFQNSDGSLTAAGKARYYDGDVKSARAAYKEASKAYSKSYSNAYNKSLGGLSPFKKHRRANDERWQKAADDARAMNEAAANLKTAKAQTKLERKYKRVGDAEGRADFYKKKGDEAAKKYDESAKAFSKSAKKLENEGKHVQALAAKNISEALNNKASKKRQEYDEAANYYMKRSEALTKKASTYATKKNVDLGKKRVDSIIEASKKKGYESEQWRYAYESQRENQDYSIGG